MVISVFSLLNVQTQPVAKRRVHHTYSSGVCGAPNNEEVKPNLLKYKD